MSNERMSESFSVLTPPANVTAEGLVAAALAPVPVETGPACRASHRAMETSGAGSDLSRGHAKRTRPPRGRALRLLARASPATALAACATVGSETLAGASAAADTGRGIATEAATAART